MELDLFGMFHHHFGMYVGRYSLVNYRGDLWKNLESKVYFLIAMFVHPAILRKFCFGEYT